MGGVGQISSLISHHLIAQMPALARAGGEVEWPLRQQLWLRLFCSGGEPAAWSGEGGSGGFFNSK